ncbi:hypothetical protein, unlikely [Trypanosoma brucei gambiense DAL972]|uniref:Uncharacterized protein n=2 Tax=Trypanosoma brucei TaxID=5691 RepID=Q4GZC0_TRYB2|nr:hypothetical protein, unlikely [Trypanosoma brucei gambiense DAL972]XP_024498401.1 hypothetical protein, unlikely [Trypanosoma brucei brucei TREU927]CAJ16025.1 hypothetical protein, unlikely [Trypanosoma brucei brucei TREU927]CBH08843.1 hypothetical protein, unlikely [Trypanosoma brucei gambiense DAL972]|eukprot:XP_011771284.1 hypothetical protein, unlikely [Trypanosoma brucei gambiense DAL972]
MLSEQKGGGVKLTNGKPLAPFPQSRSVTDSAHPSLSP